MALLTSINFLGDQAAGRSRTASPTWWKIGGAAAGDPGAVASRASTAGNFTAADGFSPDGLHGILLAISTSGIIFSYLGFEQADQLAGESKNPKRDIPIAIIGAIIIGILIYVALQVAFLLALPGRRDRQDLGRDGQGPVHRSSPVRSPRSRRCSASAGWPRSCTLDAIISPAGTGLIYTTGSSRVSYGLARNGYVPTPFEWAERRGACRGSA